ncbi:NUDIX hydrolase [Morganella morganii]|uniref:NUDIX hydrolase n=1 Tax=Morganella morganii TaxID=582 RepID=UPI0032D9F254
MKIRPSARFFILNKQNEILLFHFRFNSGALSGESYWATPGGGLEPGETYEQAVCRELREETGIIRDKFGAVAAENTFPMLLPNGETVMAEERFYLVNVSDEELNFSDWTTQEKEVINDHKWWALSELTETEQQIFPVEIIVRILSEYTSGEK